MIRLHHVPFSRSFRVLWLLQEMGMPPEIVMHDIRAGDMQDQAYRDLSPAGRAPALEIDGRTVFESGAICQYLTETRPEAGLAPMPGQTDRIPYLEALHFAETMASVIEQLNLNHIFLRDPAQASPVVIKVNTARLRGTLRGMEQMLRPEGYLLPSGFSAADCMMGFNLFAAPYYVPLEPFPKLRAYRDRLAARPAYQAARALDGPQTFYTKPFYPVPEA